MLRESAKWYLWLATRHIPLRKRYDTESQKTMHLTNGQNAWLSQMFHPPALEISMRPYFQSHGLLCFLQRSTTTLSQVSGGPKGQTFGSTLNESCRSCKTTWNNALWNSNFSFERTPHQTLSILVVHIVPFDRVADSSVGLKLPPCGLLCDPKLYLICSQSRIPTFAAKWSMLLHLPGMLACAATAMRAGHRCSVCTFLPCFRFHARQHPKTWLIAWPQISSFKTEWRGVYAENVRKPRAERSQEFLITGCLWSRDWLRIRTFRHFFCQNV